MAMADLIRDFDFPEKAKDLVELRMYEVWNGILCGANRCFGSIERGLKDRYGYEGDGWSISMEGAIAEAAFAKYCNRYWDASEGQFRGAADIGTHFQIRLTTKEDYSLKVTKEDDKINVLVAMIGRRTESFDNGRTQEAVLCFRIVGWYKAEEARKRDDWYGDLGNGRTKQWWVPPAELKDPEIFKTVNTWEVKKDA
jgi:hypothetical protein